MSINMYLYEKAREVHSQDLLREAEKERRLSQLPQHCVSRYIAGKLGVLLKLGSRFKQFEHSPTALQEPL